jgi:hypothetical protein
MMKIKVHFSKKVHGIIIGSKGIMAVEKIPFSHVAVELPFGIIFESIPGGSRMIPFQRWIDEYQVIKTFEMTTEISEENVKRAISGILSELWARPYSFRQVIGILIMMTFKNSELARRIAKKFVSSTDLICTELAARFLDAIGLWTGSNSFDSISLREVYRVAWRFKSDESEGPAL